MRSHRFWIRQARRTPYGLEKRITDWGMLEKDFAKLKWYMVRPTTRIVKNNYFKFFWVGKMTINNKNPTGVLI